MTLSVRDILASALLLASAASALPQMKIDSKMPFLSTSAAGTPSSATQWWTPESTASATQSQSNTWSASSQAITSAPATSQANVPYSNPFTIYTTMTDSRGVITGMPSVATSQPTQAPVATICSGCSSVMSQQASWSSMVNSLQTTATPPAATASATSASSSAASSSAASSSATASPTFKQSTGDAPRAVAFGGGAGLGLLVAVAMLL